MKENITAALDPKNRTLGFQPTESEPRRAARDINELRPLLEQTFTQLSSTSSEWVDLAKLGLELRRLSPDFKPSDFGFDKLARLLEVSGFVEVNTDHSVMPPRKFGRLIASCAAIGGSEPISTDTAVKRGSTSGPRHAPRAATNPPPLSLWAYFGGKYPAAEGDRQRYSLRLRPMPCPEGWVTAIADLKEKALGEQWNFGASEDSSNPDPILQSYLWWTFFRLSKESKEKKIAMLGRYAAFNTGLVDHRFEPIYAWFEKNSIPDKQPFYFQGFCTAGEGPLGKRLVATINPLPGPAHYFEDPKALFYDVNAGEPVVAWEHVIGDNVIRLPMALLEDNCPQGFVLRDPKTMMVSEQERYAQQFKTALESDSRRYRSLIYRMQDALKVALKRVRWNFKTAIPQYFPTKNQMSLLLPLGLVRDDVADLALVVEKTRSGAYLGHTILPLDWAYNNARLVCRPNSDWLVPEQIQQTTVDEPQPASPSGVFERQAAETLSSKT